MFFDIPPAPDATLSLKIVDRSLAVAAWIPSHPQYELSIDGATGEVPDGHVFCPMSRSRVFSCLALFETSVLDIAPSHLEEVMAMSSGNSIFAAGVLLSDPAERAVKIDVRRIVGRFWRSRSNIHESANKAAH